LPMEVSRFHLGSPLNGLAMPARPSVLMFTLLKLLNTEAGALKRFKPHPPVAGLPLPPMFFEPGMPRLMLLPSVAGSTLDSAPELNPRKRLPPQTPGPSVTVSGSPLCAVKIPERYQPPITLFRGAKELRRCRPPNGRSYSHDVLNRWLMSKS